MNAKTYAEIIALHPELNVRGPDLYAVIETLIVSAYLSGVIDTTNEQRDELAARMSVL